MNHFFFGQKRIWQGIITTCVFTLLSGMMAGVAVPGITAYAATPIMTVAPAEGPRTEDVVTVDLPLETLDGHSVFDFHLDPQGLIEETGAVRYGGGLVEAGARLLFRNQEGPYTFSSSSDRLNVRNTGTLPAIVTVEARISGLGEAVTSSTPSFADAGCSIYLALVDDSRANMPITEDGVVILEEMLCEGEVYSFGLTGACNAHADWAGVETAPVVTVTWRVEPAYEFLEGHPEEELSEDGFTEEGSPMSDPSGDVTIVDGQDDDPSENTLPHEEQETETTSAVPVPVPEEGMPLDGDSLLPEEVQPAPESVEDDG